MTFWLPFITSGGRQSSQDVISPFLIPFWHVFFFKGFSSISLIQKQYFNSLFRISLKWSNSDEWRGIIQHVPLSYAMRVTMTTANAWRHGNRRRPLAGCRTFKQHALPPPVSTTTSWDKTHFPRLPPPAPRPRLDATLPHGRAATMLRSLCSKLTARRAAQF